MTTLSDGPGMDVVLAAYRAMRAAPPDVRLDELGAVCPLDDTMLLAEVRGWCCPTCMACWDLGGRCGMWLAGDRPLMVALVSEDNLQAAGLLPAGDRSTCRTCRAWADQAHEASEAHRAATDAVVDTYRELDEPVDGCNDAACRAVSGNCRPWLSVDGQLVDEPADDPTAAQRRRLDRRCALTVGIAAAGGLGYAAGRLASPWGHLVPTVLAWAVAGGLVVVAVAGIGAAAVWRYLAGWWPYRHNRLLGDAGGLGWDVPADGGVRHGR